MNMQKFSGTVSVLAADSRGRHLRARLATEETKRGSE